MPDIQQLLTKKIAGVPGWMVAAGVGAAAYFLVIRPAQQGQSSSSSSGTSADQFYGLGYAQGLQAGAIPTTKPTPTGQPSNGKKPGGQPRSEPAPGQKPPSARPGPASESYLQKIKDIFGPNPPPPFGTGPPLNGRPCPPGMFGPGEPYCEVGQTPTGGAAGLGGFTSAGSRSADWSGNYFHPQLKQRVIYQHFVREVPSGGIGGPARGAPHSAHVRAVAKATGIHWARLQALNPEHRGRIRVA